MRLEIFDFVSRTYAKLTGLCAIGHKDRMRSIRIPNENISFGISITDTRWTRRACVGGAEHASMFVSFANPCHLQDVPRVKMYMNACFCHESMVHAAPELIGKIVIENSTLRTAAGRMIPIRRFFMFV